MFLILVKLLSGFPGGSEGTASACTAGDLGLIPGLGRSPGEGNGIPLQYSCLENPKNRGAWWATVHGVAKSRTRLSDFTFTFKLLSLLKALLLLFFIYIVVLGSQKKNERNIQSFHVPLPRLACTASAITNTHFQDGAFVIMDNSTLTHHRHPKSVIYTVFTLGDITSMGLDKPVTTCVCHYIITHSIFTSLKILCCVLVTQSCLALCSPMKCSPPGFSGCGILQARKLKWVATSFSPNPLCSPIHPSLHPNPWQWQILLLSP